MTADPEDLWHRYSRDDSGVAPAWPTRELRWKIEAGVRALVVGVSGACLPSLFLGASIIPSCG
jgi:hypothetical protein